MSWQELHHTLVDLVAAVSPPQETALRIDGVELTVPLEMISARTNQGPTVLARMPHSRWEAGFLPQVQTGHLVIERQVAGDAP